MNNNLLHINIDHQLPLSELQESLKEYQKLFDFSLDIICSIDEHGRFLKVSAASMQLWGYLPEELVGKSFLDLVVEEDLLSTISTLQSIKKDNYVNNFENCLKRKDGTVVSLAWSSRWDDNTKVIYCVARDITERNKAQQAYRQQGDRLHRACKLAKLGIWEMDLVNNSFYSSGELFELYGLTKEGRSFVSTEEFFSLVHPEDVEPLKKALLSLGHLDTHAIKHRLRKADTGEVVYLLQDIQAVKDIKGNVVRIHGTAKDITEIEKAHNALEQSEKELRANAQRLTEIVETLGDGFVTLDRNFIVTYWNKKAEELLGVQRKYLLGKSLWSFFSQASESKAFKEYNRALEQNVPVHFEQYYTPAHLFLEVSAYPSKDGLSVYFRNITDQKRKDLELKISNERFEFVSKATSEIIWDCDIVRRVTFYNEAFTHLFGHPHFEQQSADIWDKNVHPDDWPGVVVKVENALKNSSVSNLDVHYRFRKSDDSYAFVHDRALIIRDGKGKAIRMVGSMQDITVQKEAEFLLEKSEKRFRALVQSGQDLIALMDASFNISYVSPNYKNITGNSIKQLIGFNGFDLIHPDDYDAVITEASKIQIQRMVSLPHYRFRANDGSYKWFETTLTNFLDDEDIHAIICNTRDVTKRKAALDEVVKLSTIVQQTSNSVILTDPQGYIEWVNEAFTKRTEYSLEEAVGKHPMNILHGEETCEETLKFIVEHVEQEHSFKCELVNYTKSGRKHWVENNGKPITDKNGRIKHWFFIQTDITARKEAEEALRLSEDRYKLLFYKSPSPKWIYNAETFRVVEVNDASSELYGYSREEFLGMTIPDLKLDCDIQKFTAIVQHVLQEKDRTFGQVVWHKKKSGEVFQVEVNSHAIELVSGLHFIVTAYDLSERLALQNKIIEEKVAIQKEVTKAVINTQEKERSIISKELHDNVNQILTAAKLCIENTRYYPEQRDVFTDRGISMVQNAIQEIRSLSKTLMSPAVYESGLKVTLSGMLDQYRNIKRFDITEVLDFDEEAIDKELKLTIYRIIQELMNNTVKYAQATSVKVIVAQEGPRLAISVQDNGIGFDKSVKRSGLGLENIKSRVELFQGNLEVTSAPGKGCSTVAIFPI
jgi:PAS domain S-box-containing protein